VSLVCELIQGSAAERTVSVPSPAGATMVVIGTAGDASWRVLAEGMAPYHVQIVWHENAGWIADLAGHGDVFLGSVPVGREWTRVEHESRLQVATAVVVLRAGREAQPVRQVIDFESTRIVQEGDPTFYPPDVPSNPGAIPVVGAAAGTPLTPHAPLAGARPKPSQGSRVRIIVLSAILLLLVTGYAGWRLMLMQQPAQSAQTAQQAQAARSGQAAQRARQAAPTRPPVTPAVRRSGEAAQLEARAAQQVMLGRYADAIPLYERLQEHSPDDASIALILRIVRARAASRCGEGETGPNCP
jgi:hypothetical protein